LIVRQRALFIENIRSAAEATRAAIIVAGWALVIGTDGAAAPVLRPILAAMPE
jgi:hypothetical protein